MTESSASSLQSQTQAKLSKHRRDCLRPPPQITVSEWAERHLYLPPPQTQSPGWLRFWGREYLREPLDCFADPSIRDLVLCFGSQTGKTTVFMSGVAWAICCDPCGILWALPSIDLARSFSETRWLPMLHASPELKARIEAADRHDTKKTQQQIGGAIVNFIGANSPGNLASRPARRVILDEIDKFPHETGGAGGEADAVDLAEQRTKSFSNPLRAKSSTPTTVDGLIWQEFCKGDMRRRLIPCPHCARFVCLAWSPEFTLLDKLGCEAFIRWDKEARRRKGEWDLDRVERSARAECPFCGGHIRDEQKTALDRRGKWEPTKAAAKGFRSYHLSSLYAATPETSFGKLAVAFIQKSSSLLGLQGFINGNLAEPWEHQDGRSERVEIVSPPEAEALPEAVQLMTVDVQATAPYFWFVVRAWDKAGNSRLVTAGHCDDWETVRRVQTAHGVADNHVLIDSGDQTETVYNECLRWGRAVRRAFGQKPQWVGWMPSKGREKEARWVDSRSKEARPYFAAGPGAALPPSAPYWLPLFEYNGEFLLDLLVRLRKRKDPARRWEVIDMPAGNPADGAVYCPSEEYFRHIDAKVFRPFATGRTRRIEWRWVKRSDRWPDHLLDCEIMQVAWAMFHRRLPVFAPEPINPASPDQPADFSRQTTNKPADGTNS